jgi:predicted lipoprotein with Yx(FWY)xxD motif
MTRLLAAATVAASLVLAACGGGGSSSSTTPAATSTTVAVKSISGVGDVLVDSAGKALYSSNVEAGGKVMCTGACTSFWKPLEPSGTTPTASGNAGKLGVIKRPDGTMQVTSNGLPLYTFAQDNSGDAKGDGFTDDFDGEHFVWHAVLAGGKAASLQDSAGTSSSGDGSSGGGGYSAGGY